MRTHERAERKHFHRARRARRAFATRARRVCKARRVLDDGVYDAVIIDAEARDDMVAIDLVIVTGANKGDVVRVKTSAADDDVVMLLGLPATITVTEGEPTVALD
jgi:hypothetical protein